MDGEGRDKVESKLEENAAPGLDSLELGRGAGEASGHSIQAWKRCAPQRRAVTGGLCCHPVELLKITVMET